MPDISTVPSEHAGSARSGIVLYPISVLLLVLVFPTRLDIAAAAWAILAVGDGMATIAGRRLGWGAIPWNREKSFAGTFAFFFCGGLAGALLAWWCRPNVTPAPELWFSVAAPFVAALVAAFVETIPVRLDDNSRFRPRPRRCSGRCRSFARISSDRRLRLVVRSIVLPRLANVIVAWLGYRARTVTLAGAVTGAVIGTAIAVTAGWPGWTLLLATFLAASISSRLGLRRKTLLGIAEERGGRRGAGNAIANTGFATAAALLSVDHRTLEHVLRHRLGNRQHPPASGDRQNRFADGLH